MNGYLETYGEASGFASAEAFYEANAKEDVKIVLLQENVMGFLAETVKITDAE